MNHEQHAYEVTSGVLRALVRAVAKVALCFIVGGFLLRLLVNTDSTDQSRWRRSGLSVYTDAQTGVQYVGNRHGLTPRIGFDTPTPQAPKETPTDE